MAGDAEVFEGLAEDDFGLAVGVDVGGVDEVDAGVDGGFEELIGAGLVDAIDGFPDAFVGGREGHGAEADFGDEEAGVAEGVEFHG